ncbi:MAG: pyruvate ferredoxin oxidoreductase gamma subunit [Thermosediminibacterales bacterium]|nr:pyruvate ferredoxin oxidoreductase gamma subunit [Thermosediminibacterales bacterium]MDK2836046.1 pyruvate ferredoxin oxidoreductase gamma subunit [Thermosediminibacterales bacterium]
MSNVIEIRWHGRGGQGAKTAALLLAQSASQVGKFVQGFPEYGPERMGAPVTAFNRISDKEIRIHSSIANPDVVVILDPTLIGGTADVTAGAQDSIFVINTSKTPQEMREKLKISGGKVFTVDAGKIAEETIGKNIPNTPLMGALIKATGIIPFEGFLEDTKRQLKKKFKSKPEVIDGNIKAIERAYQEVKSE